MNILCKYEPKKLLHFLFICIFRKSCFVCKSMGNGPVEGTITSILKRWKHYYFYYYYFYYFFIPFSQKMSCYYPWTKIKLIPLGPHPQSIKSSLSLCDFTRVKIKSTSKYCVEIISLNIKFITWKKLDLIMMYILSHPVGVISWQAS